MTGGVRGGQREIDGEFAARASARLSSIAGLIAGDEPLQGVMAAIVGSVGELFGITHTILRVLDDDVRRTLPWMFTGYPEESVRAIQDLMRSEYYPSDLISQMVREGEQVTAHGYFVSAEVWLRLADQDRFVNTPAYYRSPERLRDVRREGDRWLEGDSYEFLLKAPDGTLLAWLELGYSRDDRLLSQDELEMVEPFVGMATIAMLREKMRLRREATRSRAAQRAELLEDLLRISSSIVSERDFGKLSHMILSSVSSLFGFRRVSLLVYDEGEGVFKWTALFGYPEEAVKETAERSVPTDVILEDLKESRRIGRSVYFTKAEDMTPRQLVHFVIRPEPGRRFDTPPRKPGEFRPYDCLAFSLHDATGRIVGVIYPSEPKEGQLPDKDAIETMEIFTSLAEVAIENARLSSDREAALRISNQRTEQLSRILDMTSGMMYVRDLDQMLDTLLKTLAQLLGIRRMAIGIKRPELGEYRVEAVYGYPAKAVEEIKKIGYAISAVDSIHSPSPAIPASSMVKWRKKIGRMSYYMPAESQTLSAIEMVYYPEQEAIRLPRRGKGYWHELDYIDTFIFDSKGDSIAYLEILKPRDDRVPDPETIEIIEIFASLAGIAIENARVFQEHVESRKQAELYTDVLSHDIKNYNQAIMGYLDLLRMKLKDSGNAALLDRISEQVSNTMWLAANVRTLSKMAFAEAELSRVDLGKVLQECRKSVVQYYPGRNVVFKGEVDERTYFTEADDLVRELFINILTNAVKYDPHDPVEIEMSVGPAEGVGPKSWVVSIADHGRGIPDDLKGIVFDRFSKASTKKGSGMGLHIVKTLAARYHGRVWVEDRVPGDHAQGCVFKVVLPAA